MTSSYHGNGIPSTHTICLPEETLYNFLTAHKGVVRYKETNISILSCMQITSPAFLHNEKIPIKYTCEGDNISPPLTIEDVPKNAVCLVLIMHDPDAPGKDWLHWSMWNIPPSTTTMNEGEVVPNAIEGKNDADDTGYVGPCPPSGTHRYHFQLYAVDRMIDIPSGAERKALIHALAEHIIDEALLIGTYSRTAQPREEESD